MKRTITLSLILSLFVNLTYAQDKLNLDPTASSRFTVTDRVWPANVGEADVCLWDDDRLAAFTITIDDNNEGDIPFWKTMNTKYGFNFTWFVITEADPQYNVTTEGWVKYNELASTGNQINGHDDRNWYKPGEGTNPTPEDYLARLQATQDKVNAEVTTGNNSCLTYAYPYGDGNIDEARKLFISMRGTVGILNLADKVNYLDVNSVSNPHIYADDAKRDTYILPLVTKTSNLWGQNYYRGWGSTHFHHVNAASQTTTDEFLQYLADKGDSLWVDGFTSIAQYSQSYTTHNLVIDDVQATQVKFTLTDDMLNSAFDFPLTVKIRVANNWANISATQNGVNVDAKLISHEGNTYALVKSVPDAGQVTVTGVEDNDPAIITPIEDKQVQEEQELEVGFSASNTAGDAIAFTVEGNPSFGVFTDNGDNTGKIVFSPQLYDKGVYNITVIADNGTSKSSESFQLTVVDDGSTATVVSSKKDAAVYFPEHGFVDPNNRVNVIAGGGYVAGKQMASVFPFELPAILTGMEVIDVKFSVNLESVNASTTGNIDLYALNARSSDNVLVTDSYAGIFGTSNNGTGIQDDFATKTTPVGIVNASPVGETTLVTFLNNQYGTASAGDFIFLRLNTDDINNPQYGRIVFTTADGAEANATPSPTLIIKFGATLSNNNSEFSDVTVYPNPVNSGIINVKSNSFKNNANVAVRIFNVEGKIVHKENKIINNGKFQLNIGSSLNSGIYYLRVSDEDITTVKKILVK